MNDFVSAIVPVHNGEARLPQCVERLVETLSDLAQRFEILIVDDASTDQTVEVARQLVSQYPQVRVLRHRRKLGTSASIQSGIAQARGRAVVLQDDQKTLCPALPGEASGEQFRLDPCSARTRRYSPSTFTGHLRRLVKTTP